MIEKYPKEITRVFLEVFRLNGLLLQVGDRIAGKSGLSSARWQVLGALVLAGGTLTVPRIAEAMGLTRQGVQKQVGALVALGLLKKMDNPRSKLSPLVAVTRRGREVYGAIDAAYALWASELSEGFEGEDLSRVASTLERLRMAMAQKAVPGSRGKARQHERTRKEMG